MRLLLLLAGLTLLNAQDSRISFQMNGPVNAKTTLSKSTSDESIIYTQPLLGQQDRGMQLLYNQLSKDAFSAPLVGVYLIEKSKGIEILLQSGFDTISQSCSCYWIDTTVFESQKLPSSANYQIAFRGAASGSAAAMNLESGLFGIAWGKKLIEGETSTSAADSVADPAPPSVPTTTTASPSKPSTSSTFIVSPTSTTEKSTIKNVSGSQKSQYDIYLSFLTLICLTLVI